MLRSPHSDSATTNSFTVSPGRGQPPGLRRAAEHHHGRRGHQPGGDGAGVRPVRQPGDQRQQRPGDAGRGQRPRRLHRRQHDDGDRQRRRRHLQQPGAGHRGQLHAERERQRRPQRPRLRQLHRQPGGGQPPGLRRAAEHHRGRRGHQPGGDGAGARPLRQPGDQRQQRSGDAGGRERAGRLRQRQHHDGDRQRRRRHLQQPGAGHGGQLHAGRERQRRPERPRLRQLHRHPGRGRTTWPSACSRATPWRAWPSARR